MRTFQSPSILCASLAEHMVKVGEVFTSLALPLKLGLMSVLSSKKISVLDKQLFQLVQTIASKQL